MAIKVLKGKSLASAIAGQGKKFDTFKAREHQLAFSCLVHRGDNNCVSHLNNLLNVTPVNYRGGLIAWAKEFGAVTFDAKSGQFDLPRDKNGKVKGSPDLEAAEKIAPADFKKDRTAKEPGKFDAVKFAERALKKLVDEGADPAVIAAMKGVVRAAETAKDSVAVRVMKETPAEKSEKARIVKKAAKAVKGKVITAKKKAAPKKAEPVAETAAIAA